MYRGASRVDVVVDISDVWEKRVAAVKAHVSQLDATAPGDATYLTRPGFLDEIEGRARVFGARTGGTYGEGYRSRGPLVLADPAALLGGGRYT
jgi:LmbE family N-acetylglucosaminyl deacetylase